MPQFSGISTGPQQLHNLNSYRIPGKLEQMCWQGAGYSEMKEKLNQQQMKTKLKGENKQSEYLQFTFHQVQQGVKPGDIPIRQLCG